MTNEHAFRKAAQRPAAELVSHYKRWRVEAEDRLRYHRHIRRALSCWCTSTARESNIEGVIRLCTAARLADRYEAEDRIQRRIVEGVARLDLSSIDWTELVADFFDPRIERATVLKPWIGPNEKGVLFVAFEKEWIKLLAARDVGGLADRYRIVIAPSSSPHNFVNYAFARAYPGEIFSLISNPRDLDVLPRVSTRLTVVPLYASHWVNPELFDPLPRAERSYDLVMIASWGKVKRHHALFAALRAMPESLRVLLVGQDQEGRTANTIRDLSRWYGVEHRVTLLANQPYTTVVQLLCRARASVVLSKREGSCVVVAESMFADAPVAVIEDATIGSRAFINDQTGRLLRERSLSRDLYDFVHAADEFRPRAWAERNISCFVSTRVLNDALKQRAVSRGESWTQDIAPLQWSPNPTLVRAEDACRLAQERADLEKRHGVRIGPPAPAR